MNKARILVAALSLSASAFVGLAVREGWTDRAVIPTQGDVPTVGFGSTQRDDGSPVRMGDTITPVRAIIRAQAHISADEQQFRDSLPGVKLTQGEYDVYVDFVYQYGIGNWRTSSMRKHLMAGEYAQACDALLLWKHAAGYDCSTPGNHRCPGVWARQLERHEKCEAEQ